MALLPCDADGACMVCKLKPDPDQTLSCRTCATPWHLACFPESPFASSSDNAGAWDCPDCTDLPNTAADKPFAAAPGGGIVSAILAIQADASLTDDEKARRRQQLFVGASAAVSRDKSNPKVKEELLLICTICWNVAERPVSTPCGHNFCLTCFQTNVKKAKIDRKKPSCALCRASIPESMVANPRINPAISNAIRFIKSKKPVAPDPPKVYHYADNQDRPDTAFTTERAKKTGKANACSGRIFVTIPPDHFGPITAEYDPIRNQGVLVGETWNDRMDCRQWGAHFPHVAGIAGQSAHGAQSVALSGGYEDDEDHGEWFLYTGSGGRDLSGNKRTNKIQSFDQKFENMNEALRFSCLKGYPVRVVRSHKEKRTSYAPESGVRYDGIYRIEKCWRKNGKQGLKVCRYLFVRCDNEPAPWTSDLKGDRPRDLPEIHELKKAVDITERKQSPHWDYNPEKECWCWVKDEPKSKKSRKIKSQVGAPARIKRIIKRVSVKDQLVKEFGCEICRKVMSYPTCTPCGHNFCKACIEGAFAGQSFIRNRACQGGRSLRAQKNIMKCPSCPSDIAEFLQDVKVNHAMMEFIESLKQQAEQEEHSDDSGDKTEEDHSSHSDESTDKGEENPEEGSKSGDSSENVPEEIEDNDLKKPNKKRKV